MSQPINPIQTNGPRPEFNETTDPNKLQNGTKIGPTTAFIATNPPRPPLARTDSRNAFPIRPGYPNPPLGSRPPLRLPPGAPFPQRPPGVPLRPPFQPPFPQNQPFPIRPPIRQIAPRPPRPLLPQSSLPETPKLEGIELVRSHTVDPDFKNGYPDRRPMSRTDSSGSISHSNESLHRVRFDPDPESRPGSEHSRISSPIVVENRAKDPPIQDEVKELPKIDLVLKDIDKKSTLLEGDNDSGVDESTQGNDQSSNGDTTSPRKSAGKLPRRIAAQTPNKSRSLSRDTKSPILKSPDSGATTPGSTERKKLPMNKIQVGSAPSPNLKEVRSKIGSLQNATHKPGGGHVKIETKKIELKNVTPRIEAKNDKYAPSGGEKKIISKKLNWNAQSKIGSLENASHKPKESEKKIETVKLDFKEKAKSKVGSKDNLKHQPGGGNVKIENKKLDIKAQSKVGSMDNVKHKPLGGDKKIFDDKEYLRQMSGAASDRHSLAGSESSLPSQPPDADENLNQH